MAKDLGDDFGSDFDMGGSKKVFGGSKIKWETLLPIIIIIVVILLIVFRTNILATGLNIFGAKQGAKILILGAPSPEFRAILTDQENKDIIKEARFMTLDSISHNPEERIKNYDIIILDQSMQADKTVTRRTGEAITNYVRKGGRLIVVLNSGIKRPDDPSVLGWQANFGGIVPVNCYNSGGTPSCLSQRDLQGTLYVIKEDHPVVKGITQVPAVETSGSIRTQTFDVSIDGTEIAYLEDSRTKKTYTGIVEEPLLMGKVIYFNFNPAISKAIVIKTIQYMS
ncbi:MAG TPA: hypothetical protein PK655_01980 [archaeon]|jgi:hypothetical protein|nr:hypothetical protein [archaeon]HPV66204.1 hypothetical protein [archaeon]